VVLGAQPATVYTIAAIKINVSMRRPCKGDSSLSI
jgi:hypothetical protein